MFHGDQTGFASGCKMFISAVKFDILTFHFRSQHRVDVEQGFWYFFGTGFVFLQLEEHKQYDCLVGGQQQQFSSKDT